MPIEGGTVANNPFVNPALSNNQNTIAANPHTQTNQKEEVAPPPAFVIPDNYQRGTGISLFGKKGSAILEENTTRIYRRK